MCHPGSHCLNGELVGLRYHFLLGASPDCLYPFMDFMLPLPLIAVQNLSMQEIIKTFELIEEFGGNLKIKDSETGRSVLLEAANKLARRDEEYAAEFPSFLNWLVKSKRFRINEIDIEEGCSILHFVAFTQHEHLLVAILKKCLELGADPQFEDHEGLNALVYLAKFQSLETLITVMEQIPEFRKQEVLIRAISKTPWTSKQRSYLKEWKKAVLNS
ncbi:hypothetical protein G9A89_010688 [Geosiphon pyriformis]|nr:hypothetical protein G9A89_010688 [Geosiphon pyriformis]